VNDDERRQAASFWQFSLRLYSRPEVAAACLALQLQCAADVNLVLYLLWLASQRRKATDADIRHAMSHTADWQQSIVSVLRVLRGKLKTFSSIAEERLATLRDYVCRAELEAERLEQLDLEQQTAHSTTQFAGSSAVAAAANLVAYGALLRRPFPAAETEVLVQALAQDAESAQ
jgi:uncharacterized protein (TIGR02444 family)